MFFVVIMVERFSEKPYTYHMYSHDIKADKKKLHIGVCFIEGDVYFRKLDNAYVENALVGLYLLCTYFILRCKMYLVNWAQESSNNSSCYDISVFRADIFVARSEPD